MKGIIIGIIVSVVILATLISLYYYYNRDNNCKKFHETFDYDIIEKYNKLDSVYDLKPIFSIIVNSTSERLQKYGKQIASIVKQNVKADRLILALPLKEEEKGVFMKIPKWNYKIFVPLPEIKSAENDKIGTCVITHTNLFKYGEHLCLVLRDDKIYPEDYVSKILKKYEENPGKIIHDKKKGGYLYEPKFFDQALLVDNIAKPLVNIYKVNL